jgi:hypothetical protein
LTVNAIAGWNGSNWFALGGSVNSTVLALAATGNDLYAGGYFTNAGGVSANRIAKWDGGSWSALGSGLGSGSNDWVAAIAVDGTNVYASGIFTNAGATSANYIAQWNGTTWAPLASGTSIGSPPAVYGLAVGGGSVYAGGTFFNAGVKPSVSFAIWNPPGVASLIATVEILPNGNRLITWTSAPNQTYRVYSTTDLLQPFTPFSGIIPSGGTSTSYIDSSAPGASRFYGVVQQ